MMESPVWRLIFKMFYFAHAQTFPLLPVSFKIISIFAHLMVVYPFPAQIYVSEMRVQTWCYLSFSPPHWLVNEWEPQLLSGLTAGWLAFCRMLKRSFIPSCFQMQVLGLSNSNVLIPPRVLKNLLSPKPLFAAEMQASEVFSTLLGLHLGVFPSCPCRVVFAGWQGRSLLNLAQQLRHGCSCFQDSWVLADKQQCWYLNPSHQPLITLTLSYVPSLLSPLNAWQPEVSWPILMFSCCHTGHMLGSVLPSAFSAQARGKCCAWVMKHISGCVVLLVAWCSWKPFNKFFLSFLLSICHYCAVGVCHLSATGFLLFKWDAQMKNGKVGSK